MEEEKVERYFDKTSKKTEEEDAVAPFVFINIKVCR